MSIINVWLLSNGLRRFWLYHHDRCHVLIQTCIFGAETQTHHGAGVRSTFVFCRQPLLEHPTSTSLSVQLSGKAHEDSDYTAMNSIVYWRLSAKTHPSGEIVSTVLFLFSFWLPLLAWLKQHGHHVSYVLNGTSRKLAAYIMQAAFEWGFSSCWWMQTGLSKYSQGQNKIWYQECSCHL